MAMKSSYKHKGLQKRRTNLLDLLTFFVMIQYKILNIRNLFCLLTIFLFVTYVFSSCKDNHTASNDRIQITTSIEPLAEMVRMIADSSVNVSSLLPNGISAENYELTTSDVKKISTSQIYLAIGDLGFEKGRLEKMEQIFTNTKFLLLSAGFSHEHCHIHSDPHIWTSIRGIKYLISGISDILQQTIPSNAETYQQRTSEILSVLDSIHKNTSQNLSDAKVKGFVIYHPSLTDYSEEFGITQLCIEQDGNEPNAYQLASIINKARQMNVRTVFIQKEFTSRLTESIAKELKANVVEINPLDKNPIQEVQNITEKLIENQKN